jgi:hypothetical protein
MAIVHSTGVTVVTGLPDTMLRETNVEELFPGSVATAADSGNVRAQGPPAEWAGPWSMACAAWAE